MPNPNEVQANVEGELSLQERYEAMSNAEQGGTDADLPPMAREREEAAMAMANAVFSAARNLIAHGTLKAAGYRVLVKPIEVVRGLEEAEAAQHPTLADQGFEVKTLAEASREERGENHGVVIDIGPIAFERHGGRKNWCDKGDVVVFNRYAGTRVEHPPGSKVFYQAMNDEDIFLVVK